MKNKVALLACNNYKYENLKEVLKSTVKHLGGFDKYLKKTDRILLKVNLLMKKKPDDAVTTHPNFVKALAAILIENGNTVVIGDSPGGMFTEKALNSVYKVSGYEDIESSSDAKLNYNVDSFEKNFPEGLLLKKMTLVDMLNDVDKVISVSKLKTHGMMTFTGAVKNMFGIIPGVTKAEYHLHMNDYDDFSNALIDICLCGKPVLSFMDGIVGMEGDGPSAGTPRNTNLILASESPYCLDKVACSIINLDFEKVPTIRNSIKRGLCTKGLEDVELLGGEIKDFFIEDFKIAETKILNPASNMPRPLRSLITTIAASKPIVDQNICIGCGDCADNCPAKVIEIKNKKANIALKDCIRCYCCQELCPVKAVKINKSFLSKFLK